MNEREQLLQNVKGAIPIANQMKQIMLEINQSEDIIERKKKFWGGYRAVIINFFAIIFFIAGISDLINEPGDRMQGFIAALISGAVIYGYIMYLKRVKNEKKKIESLNQKHMELAQNSALSWLPAQYRYFSCIYMISEYLNNGRADNMKEALNLLEEDIHRLHMRDAAAIGAYIGAKSGM